MRNLLGLTLLAITLIHCGSSGTVTEDSGSQEAGAQIPEWFNRQVSSSSDSTSFNGFAHAVAANWMEAEELSKQAAVQNLRFEIDRFAENKRAELTESSDAQAYGSVSFIFSLRNAVQQLDLSSAELESVEIREGNEVREVFTRASLSRETVIEQLSDLLGNRDFLTFLSESE